MSTAIFATDHVLEQRIADGEAAIRTWMQPKNPKDTPKPVPSYLRGRVETDRAELERRRRQREAGAKDKARLHKSNIYNDAVLTKAREAYAAWIQDNAALANLERTIGAEQAALEQAKIEWSESEAQHMTGEIGDPEFALRRAKYTAATQHYEQASADLRRLRRQAPIRRNQFFSIEQDAQKRAAELRKPLTTKLVESMREMDDAYTALRNLDADISKSMPRECWSPAGIIGPAIGQVRRWAKEYGGTR